jgi:hypothetical protein
MPNNNPLGIGCPQKPHVDLSIIRGAKYCISCGEYKSHSEYTKHSGSRDGRRADCKECRKYYMNFNRFSKLEEKGFEVKECKCGMMYKVRKEDNGKCWQCNSKRKWE